MDLFHGTSSHTHLCKSKSQSNQAENQFFGLQLDRGNLSNALTDHFLADLNMTTDDYNNVRNPLSHPSTIPSTNPLEITQGSTIQLVCFLAAEFPVQLLIKRFGFKRVLPVMMLAWSLVSWTQAWMTSRASFYVTRALIGAFEGGFIPGTILFATYFYKTKELSVRLAFFWSTLNVSILHWMVMEMGMRDKIGLIYDDGDVLGCSHCLVPASCWNSADAWR